MSVTMKQFSFVILLLIVHAFVQAQAGKDYLRESIYQLTSPTFKGRGYINGGADSAANYLSNTYLEIGLSTLGLSFQQSFSITTFGRTNHQSTIQINDQQYVIWNDFAIHPFHLEVERGQFIGEHKLYPFFRNDSVFLYKDIEFTDCLVKTTLIREGDKFQTIVEADTLADKFFGRKYMTACLTSHIKKPSLNLYTSPSLSRKLKRVAKGNNKALVKEAVTINLLRDTSNYLCNNIVGRLGVESKSDSTILITAHYDHLGQRHTKFYPGANDNASGVAVMLELASRLHKAADEGWQSKYNVCFVAFGAEEYGLLGSKYFVESGIIDSMHIKCVLNLDMVGGQGGEIKKHPKGLYLLKCENISAHCVQSLKNASNRNSGVDFILNGNPKYLKYSDQASFINLKIPALFIFSGEDEIIHTVNDTADKLNFEKMESLVEVLSDWLMTY